MMLVAGYFWERAKRWPEIFRRFAAAAQWGALLLAANIVSAATPFATSSNPEILPAASIVFTPNGTGYSVRLTLAPDSEGTSILNFFVTEGAETARLIPPFVPVTHQPPPPNSPPTLNPIAAITIGEDAGQQTIPLSGITSGAAGEDQGLVVSARSSDPSLIPNPIINYVSPRTSGSLLFTPVPNANGTAAITVSVNDGQSQNSFITRTFEVNVASVNDAPTLNPIANIVIYKNDSRQTIPLSGISPGAPNEQQSLAITTTSSNPGLIPNPVVNYSNPNATGTLTFTPAPDAHGYATITVTVADGGSPNGTLSRSFTILVTKANSVPTLDPVSDFTIEEDSPLQTIALTGIGPGGGDDPQPLNVTATSSNPALIPNPTVLYVSPGNRGTLRLAPAPNATGTATITVTLNDGQLLNHTVTRSFNVTVTPVNDPPIISNIPNRTTGQNASTGPIAFTANDLESSPNSLILSAASSNPTLIPVSAIVFGGSGSNRTVTITPAQFQNGSSTITITARDPDGITASESFLLTVIDGNTPPTLNALANLNLTEDAGLQSVALSGISPGSGDENQKVTITATSSNPGLIPTPAISYSSPDTTGQITFQPVANGNGTAIITVRVDDGESQNNAVTRSFAVTVDAINDPPTISAIPTQRVEPGLSSPAIPFTIHDVETVQQNLRLSVASSNPGLVPTANIALGGSGSNRTVTVRPAAGVTGSSTITISVNDGVLTAATSFPFRVEPGNSPPRISIIPNQSIESHYTPNPIEFTVEDSESDPAALIVTVSSFNQTLMPDTNIVVGGFGANRTIALHPIPDSSGFATIAVTVSDGKLSTRSSFMITVDRGSPPSDQLVLQKEGNGSLAPDLSGQELTVGRVYTMTATPAAGQVFAGWSGAINSGAASLSFKMRSNMVLRARFMTNPFVAKKGAYNGLFFEPDEVRPHRSGFFSLLTTERGSFTGKLQSGGKTYSFKGNLDFDRKARVSVSRAGTNALTLAFQLGASGLPDHLAGTVTDGIWIADLAGDRAIFNSSTNPAPFAGAYTMAIPGRLGDSTSPEGDSVGTLKVDGNGLASFAGTLADGTKVTQRVQLARHGEWPFYLSLYTGKGSLLSWLTVSNRAPEDPRGDVTGLVSWLKAGQPASKVYPGGFTNETVALGSRYIPPARGQRVLDLAEGNLLFSKGNLEWDFVNHVTLGPDNRFANMSPNKLTMSLTSGSGLLAGTVTDTTSGKSLKFNGVILQKQNGALGSLVGTNRCSQVVLFK